MMDRKIPKDNRTRAGWDDKICYAGIALAIIAMVCMAVEYTQDSPPLQHLDIVWFCVALGFALGMLLIRLRSLETWTHAGWKHPEIAVLLCGLGLGLFSYWCGMRQFGGFDQSVIIDVGWRLVNGQKPYVDFPCTLPVGFYLGAEIAFRLFGVFWSSIIKLNALYFLLTYLWTYAVLRRVLENQYLALILVLACECMTTILASYWWYNPVTSIAVVLYVASVAAVILRPESRALWISVCLSLLLAALMKPNISALAIAGGTAAMLIYPKTRWQGCVASAAAFILWLGVLAIHGTSIFQVLGSYLSVGSRGISSEQFLQGLSVPEKVFAWVCGIAVLPGLVCTARMRAPYPGRMPMLVLAAMALLSSLFGFYSNGELKLMDLSVGLLASCMLMGTIPKNGKLLRISWNWAAYLVLVCSTFTIASLGQAAIRYRVRNIGLGAYFEFQTDDEPIQNDFFRGVTGSYNLNLSVKLINRLISVEDSKTIFFGPRLQWAYAAYHIQSPKGMPIWWHPGVAFSAKDEDFYGDRWIANRYDPFVIMDAHYMNDRLLASIRQDYFVIASVPLHPDAGLLTILNRKDGRFSPLLIRNHEPSH